MTIKEAIKRIMQTKDYLRECRDEDLKSEKFPELKPLIKDTYKENAQSLDLAISALRAQQERENPQPLTLEELQGAKSTIEEIYEAYLFSETDMVDLRCYDEELQQVHTALEKMIAYRTKPKEDAHD